MNIKLMSIDQALQVVRCLSTNLNDYDTEALDTLCHWVEWKLKEERGELMVKTWSKGSINDCH